MLVAHWAIHDGRVLDLDSQIGNTRRMTVEPYDHHPELEGERLIKPASAGALPLYYDVSQPPPGS
jgi:hypothetical protein